MNERRFGALLRRAGISEAQFAELKSEAAKAECSLQEAVVRRGTLSRTDLYRLLSREFGIPYVDIANYIVDAALLSVIPADIAQRLSAIPLYRIDGTLAVALADPDDIPVLDELRRITRLEIQPMLADPEALRKALRNLIERSDFPQIVLRLGYATRVQPTPRRDVGDVVI